MAMMSISAMVADIERISDKLIAARDAALTAAISDLTALAQRCDADGIPFVVEDHVEMLRGLVGLGTGFGDEGNDIYCDDELTSPADDTLLRAHSSWDEEADDDKPNTAE